MEKRTLQQLQAALDAIGNDLSPRVEELARKSTEGQLTQDESDEYAEIVRLNDLENLCLCCIRCNQKKRPNIASVDPETRLVVALFHPRRQSWIEHFSQEETGSCTGSHLRGARPCSCWT